MNKVYLLIGGNLGDKEKNLRIAKNHIQASVGKIMQESPVYETAPWGFDHKESFLNQALLIETKSDPHGLLRALLDIEIAMGRTRNLERYSGRTMDIDILFFNSEIIDEEDLKIPHPRIQERKFTLIPLNGIATTYVHPVLQKNISTLLDECNDKLLVKKI